MSLTIRIELRRVSQNNETDLWVVNVVLRVWREFYRHILRVCAYKCPRSVLIDLSVENSCPRLSDQIPFRSLSEVFAVLSRNAWKRCALNELRKIDKLLFSVFSYVSFLKSNKYMRCRFQFKSMKYNKIRKQWLLLIQNHHFHISNLYK